MTGVHPNSISGRAHDGNAETSSSNLPHEGFRNMGTAQMLPLQDYRFDRKAGPRREALALFMPTCGPGKTWL